LDIVVKDNIRKAIRELNRNEKTTIILTTHDLSDIELLCKRIILIDKGRLVYDGELSHIRDTFGKVREISFTLADGSAAIDFDVPKHEDLAVVREGAQVSVRFNTSVIHLPDMLAKILAAARVSDIAVKDIDVEEILRRVYTRQAVL